MAVDQKMRDKLVGIAISVLTAGLIGAFTWAWNLNSDIAVMQSRMLQDNNSRETADAVLKDWSSIISTQESHSRQLQNLWGKMNEAQNKEEAALQRLVRIEVQQEICCD